MLVLDLECTVLLVAMGIQNRKNPSCVYSGILIIVSKMFSRAFLPDTCRWPSIQNNNFN